MTPPILQSAAERGTKGSVRPPTVTFHCPCGEDWANAEFPIAGHYRCSCGMEFVAEVFYQRGFNLLALSEVKE